MYYNCIVPECRNSSTKYPDKIFVQVPSREPRRSQWIEAAGRDTSDFSVKTTSIFVCEDHFDIEHDMENYMRWKMLGGVKIMRKDVLPHKFNGPRIKRVAKQTNKNVPRKDPLLKLHASSNTKSRPQNPSSPVLPTNVPLKHPLLEIDKLSSTKSRPQSPSTVALVVENIPTKHPLLELDGLSNTKSGPANPSSASLPENGPTKHLLSELHALSNTNTGPQSPFRPARRTVGINVRPRPKDQQTQTDNIIGTTYLLASEEFENCQAKTFNETVSISKPSFTLELQNSDDDNVISDSDSDVDDHGGRVFVWLKGS